MIHCCSLSSKSCVFPYLTIQAIATRDTKKKLLWLVSWDVGIGAVVYSHWLGKILWRGKGIHLWNFICFTAAWWNMNTIPFMFPSTDWIGLYSGVVMTVQIINDLLTRGIGIYNQSSYIKTQMQFETGGKKKKSQAKLKFPMLLLGPSLRAFCLINK